MIYRVKKNKDNPYFQLNRAALSDDRLSYKAVGLHTYLMSKPNDWEAHEIDLINRHQDGQAAVRAGIAELIQYGYMTRVQMRKGKKITGWRLDVYESPEINPHFKADQPPEYVVVDLDCDNHNVGELDCEKLDVEKLHVGNRNHSKYREEVNTDSTDTDTNVSVPAEPAPTVTKIFSEKLEALRNTKNKAALLHQYFIECYGDADVPDYSYLGKVAKDVGGAGRLFELMWQNSTKPPTGDVLAYLKSVAKGNGKWNGAKGNGHVSGSGLDDYPTLSADEEQRIRDDVRAKNAARKGRTARQGL